MSFILNGLVYDKPMFSIVAYNRAQLATAFEQMEKLRKSGHLAGYVRREAFLQQETDGLWSRLSAVNQLRHHKLSRPPHLLSVRREKSSLKNFSESENFFQ